MFSLGWVSPSGLLVVGEELMKDGRAEVTGDLKVKGAICQGQKIEMTKRRG